MIYHRKKINMDTVALVVIDLQERFAPAITDFSQVVTHTVQAIIGARLLDIPVVLTEQYPEKLGSTVGEIKAAAGETPCFEKMSFSALGSGAFKTWLENSSVKQVVLAGIETHVCVMQTALDLIACGYEVFFLEECISSRSVENKQNAMGRMQAVGAQACVIESFLFEAMGACTHPRFKDISKLVK